MVSKTLSNIKNTMKLPEFSTSQFYCWIFFSFSQRSDIPGTERTSVTNSWNKNHKVKMLKIKRLGPVERVLKFVMPVGTHAEINWDCHSPNSPFIRWRRRQSMGTSVLRKPDSLDLDLSKATRWGREREGREERETIGVE